MEDSTSVETNILPCNSIVFRSAGKTKIDGDTGFFHGEAFLLGENETGLSVIYLDECPTCSEVDSLLNRSRTRGVNSLHVGSILDLGDGRGLNLQVVLDDPDTPHHAHIIGLPTENENKKLANDIAEDLTTVSRTERRLFPTKFNEE